MPVLPASSVALQTTVVVPIGKSDPEAGSQTTTGSPRHSFVISGSGNSTTMPAFGTHSASMFSGQASTGALSSTTEIVKVQLDLLPALSVPWQTTVVSPRLKTLPEAGTQMIETFAAASQSSFAVGSGYSTTIVPSSEVH